MKIFISERDELVDFIKISVERELDSTKDYEFTGNYILCGYYSPDRPLIIRRYKNKSDANIQLRRIVEDNTDASII